MNEIVPQILPFFFPVFWCAISYLLALSGGWISLAQTRRASPTLSLSKRYMRSATIGGVNYNGALITGATKTGLYLGVLLPFRFGHQPLLLPWDTLTRRADSWGRAVLETEGGRLMKLSKRELNGLLSEARSQGADVEHLLEV